jgi:hypothetical protein
MAVDNNSAQLNSDAADNEEQWDADQGTDLQNWQLGSPEGKKSNLRVVSAELGRTHEEYRDLDRQVSDFIACQMPEEAMQYEDDIYVCVPPVDLKNSVT